jgi:hypothetical protein
MRCGGVGNMASRIVTPFVVNGGYLPVELKKGETVRDTYLQIHRHPVKIKPKKKLTLIEQAERGLRQMNKVTELIPKHSFPPGLISKKVRKGTAPKIEAFYYEPKPITFKINKKSTYIIKSDERLEHKHAVYINTRNNVAYTFLKEWAQKITAVPLVYLYLVNVINGVYPRIKDGDTILYAGNVYE